MVAVCEFIFVLRLLNMVVWDVPRLVIWFPTELNPAELLAVRAVNLLVLSLIPLIKSCCPDTMVFLAAVKAPVNSVLVVVKAPVISVLVVVRAPDILSCPALKVVSIAFCPSVMLFPRIV